MFDKKETCFPNLRTLPKDESREDEAGPQKISSRHQAGSHSESTTNTSRAGGRTEDIATKTEPYFGTKNSENLPPETLYLGIVGIVEWGAQSGVNSPAQVGDVAQIKQGGSVEVVRTAQVKPRLVVDPVKHRCGP